MNNNTKNRLVKTVWSDPNYYKKAEEGSLDFSHPAMKKLSELSKSATKILDLGCGEGTRLYKITGQGKDGYGIDISQKAISLASKKFPKLSFKAGDLEKLPYKDNTFDLVYSAYVLEHLEKPVKVISEAIRVLKKDGKLLLVAPNYGAPNRASPPNRNNRIIKIINGYIGDFLSNSSLNWQRVKPIASKKKYEIDWDTVIEPYLGSLIKFLKSKKLKIIYISSCWERELSSVNFLQKKFRLLASLGIYPFKLWGPHLIVIAEKVAIT